MRPKKIFYFPGLISLLGLPVLLLFFSPRAQLRPTKIRVFLPSDKIPDEGMTNFSRYTVLKDIENKKKIQINFGNNSSCNEQYLFIAKKKFIKREIERLQFTNDTSTVLKIELDNELSFSDFIWLLNQTLIYDIKNYALIDNTFYLFANPLPGPSPRVEMEPIYMDILEKKVSNHSM